jgi:hypothetical protein
MAGIRKSGGIYDLDAEGKQVYLHCMWKIRSAGVGVLAVHYVGCGRPGRSQQVDERPDNPQHRAWLQQYWVPRSVLFAQPRRLENLAWLQEVLNEYGCAEGLVIIETPFLKNADKVEARLIELYQEQNAAHLNKKGGKLPAKQFKPRPNHGCLKNHAADIRRRKAAGEATNVLAREFGVDPSSIRGIIRGDSYKDLA